MTIQEEMYKMIVQEIDQTLASGKEKRIIRVDRAKLAAESLTNLSTSPDDAESLVNQYMAVIKNICNSK